MASQPSATSLPPKTPGKKNKSVQKKNKVFRNKSTVPPNSHKSSLMNQLKMNNGGAAVSPDTEAVVKPPAPFASPFANKSDSSPLAPSPASREEDQEFLKLLSKKAHGRSCCRCLYDYATWPGRCAYGILAFLGSAVLQLVFFIYAKTLWDCCGIPVSKLNKEQYMFSKYMGQSGEITVMFSLLKIDKAEQLKWFETWESTDVNGDDQMDSTEFHHYFALSDMKNYLTERLFTIFNKEFNGYIKFRDFLNIAFTFAPYDIERCVELSFRLLSRRGDTFNMDTTCLDLSDIEHFVRQRYNSGGKGKKTEKWVLKTAVDLYANIDKDMSGAIDYSEFREFSLKHKTFLHYGFFFQSQLRKCIFGEEYWKEATLSRKYMFTFDEAFEKDMMEQLDWKAVINIGMAPPGMQLPMNSKCGFKEEFAEAHYAAKEKKFLAKQSKETKEWVSIALAAKTHSRMIKTFSRIVPDAMTVNTAFAIWKDVDSYTKSINEDGGESYKLMNMNLVDLKLAVQASSIQKSTQKMNAAMALGSEFDMEGEKPEDQKKETSSEKRERLAKEVMVEVAKQTIGDDDLVSEIMNRAIRGPVEENKSAKFGKPGPYKEPAFKRIGGNPLPPIDRSMKSKSEKIQNNKNVLKDVNVTMSSVYGRKALRMEIAQHFIDLEKGEENNKWEEMSVQSADTDTSRIDGFEGIAQIGALTALGGVKALANLGRPQQTRRATLPR